MDAMILSAGFGTRMRPLTQTLPKPLIKVGRLRLIEHHIVNLKKAGIDRVIINRSYLSDLFDKFIGNGSKYDLKIFYSDEGDFPLETGGGIVRALPLIQSDSFVIVSADIWSDYDFSNFRLLDDNQNCLVLVRNPRHHPSGDFILADGQIKLPENQMKSQTLTYSGIGRLCKNLFDSAQESVFPLYSIFKSAIELQQLSGVVHVGAWFDVGTMERLAEVESYLSKN